MHEQIKRWVEEFKRSTGMSIADYQKAVAAASANEEIKRLAEEFRKTCGMSIAEFQKATVAAEESLAQQSAVRTLNFVEERNRMNSAFAVPVVDNFVAPPRIDLPAESMRKRLLAYIKDFEAELDDEHEIGARLVSFGQTVTFHVESVGYYGTDMISFYGRDEKGQALQLVQHYTQLSVLLIAVLKQGEKPRRIGFLSEESN